MCAAAALGLASAALEAGWPFPKPERQPAGADSGAGRGGWARAEGSATLGTMRRGAGVLAVLVAGCSPTRAGDATTLSTSPAPASAASSAATPAPNQAKLLRLSESAFVGRLVGNAPLLVSSPSEYCLEDGQLYRGASARIGERNVFTAAPVSALVGKLVIAYGTEQPSLLDALSVAGPCPEDYGRDSPEAQMRSDWVSPERGFRTTRAVLAGLPWIRASALEPVTLHRVVDNGADHERAIVELENPFDGSLDGLTAQLHYEGGPGKPMPKLVPLSLRLPPGGTQRVEVPARIDGGPAGADEGEPRGSYRLYSIELEGTAGRTEFRATLLVGTPRRRGR